MANTNTQSSANNFHRYNAKKCKCGVATSVLAAPTGEYEVARGWKRTVFVTDSGERLHSWMVGHDHSTVVLPCRKCGDLRIARQVLGRVRDDIKCDGRCEAATGHSCDCACGGKNHGKRHAA